MDSLAAKSATPDGRLEPSNLEAIKSVFRVFSEDGIDAGLEALLAVSHEDCEFHPYPSDTSIRGRDQVREHYRRALAEGTEMKVKATSFTESGDEVLVNGSLRVTRPSGGFSESQLCWTYRFRDGRLVDAAWGPRHSA
jgi:ketosteroid isomerase-like protein